MKRLVASLSFALALTAYADHPIPEEGKHRWDFRGKAAGFSHKDYDRLFEAKTYEELRDLLPIVIESLEKDATDATPLHYASTCRLALIRTHYILGEIEKADEMLEQYSAANEPDKQFAERLEVAERRIARKKLEAAREGSVEEAAALEVLENRRCLKIYAALLDSAEFSKRQKARERLSKLTGLRVLPQNGCLSTTSTARPGRFGCGTQSLRRRRAPVSNFIR